jgi:hypothetical protein
MDTKIRNPPAGDSNRAAPLARHSPRKRYESRLRLLAEKPGDCRNENRKRSVESVGAMIKAAGMPLGRTARGWNPRTGEKMTTDATLGNFKSLTAFYVDQVNRRPWTDDLNKPRQSYGEMVKDVEKTRADVLAAAKEIGEPFTAKQMEVRLSLGKSRSSSVIGWHEKNGNLSRTNINGKLHWKLA